MPRVNIYIRNDDWEAWNNISDKPEWIHEGLNFGLVTIPPKSKHSDTPIPVSESTRDTLRRMTVGASASGLHKESDSGSLQSRSISPAEQQPTTCKAGHLLGRTGRCLQKGCKYA